MRKLLTFVAALLISGSLLAGGLVTNTNQSAMFNRLQNRNASTSIDAVYFNPAGLTKLGDGFFASINNQTIGQTKTVTNNYDYLSGTPRDFIGDVSAPIYPGVYVAYKTGKLAISAGFNPIGGGGGATYNDGLPSFEMGISDLVPIISGTLTPLAGAIPGVNNITGYEADIFFEGTSVYFGYQANVSYEIFDGLSVAVGARMVSAKNTYNGYIRDVKIEAPAAYGGTQAPGDYLRVIAGFVPDPTKSVLNGTATAIDAKTSVEADAEQTGSGFTPIISVNYSPTDKLNLAVKYEFQTKLDLTTSVKDGKDAGGMFIDGAETIADMPALLAAGAEFKPMDKLMIAVSMNMYFDKNVDYDGSESLDINMIDKNFLEYGLGLEYGLTEKLRASAGWVATSTGVNLNYQNDQRYSTNTNSLGAGIGYWISPKIDLNLGAQYTFYAEGSKDANHALPSPFPAVAFSETYNKKTWVVGVGLDFFFGKTE
jgi:long-subunit fatty acid transport protein